eukprot:2781448-Pleurochrysis_carterae.AAC.1
MWDIPRDPIGCIRSAAKLHVVPVATIVKTIVEMGLRAILGCSTGNSRLCNSEWNLFLYIGMNMSLRWLSLLQIRSQGIHKACDKHRQCHRTLPIMPCPILGLPP